MTFFNEASIASLDGEEKSRATLQGDGGILTIYIWGFKKRRDSTATALVLAVTRARWEQSGDVAVCRGRCEVVLTLERSASWINAEPISLHRRGHSEWRRRRCNLNIVRSKVASHRMSQLVPEDVLNLPLIFCQKEDLTPKKSKAYIKKCKNNMIGDI